MDRVNMYASFYVAIREGGPPTKLYNDPPTPTLTNGSDHSENGNGHSNGYAHEDF